jgi:hypothetical protein
MKQLWSCCALLLILFALSVGNSWYVAQITGTISQALNQAEDAVAQGDWETASTLTKEAQQLWEEKQTFLAITLRLCDTDEVSTGFEEVLGFLQWQAAPEYDSANGRLVAYVEHLAEVEQVTWGNLL